MTTPETPAPSSPMPTDQPATLKLPLPPDSGDQGCRLSDEVDIRPSIEMPSNSTHVQEEISETSSDVDSSSDGENGKRDRREKEATLSFDELLIADNSANEYAASDSGDPVKLVMGCQDVQAAELSELLPPETF